MRVLLRRATARRDMPDAAIRIIYGERISLTVGLVAVGIAAGCGTLVRLASGLAGGVLDSVIMRAGGPPYGSTRTWLMPTLTRRVSVPRPRSAAECGASRTVNSTTLSSAWRASGTRRSTKPAPIL